MNRTLIDTDILSYYFKGEAVVVANFQKYLAKYEIIEISLTTYYEIMSGLLFKNALKQLEIFNDFISENIVISATEESCEISSEIYLKLRKKGKLIEDSGL